MQACDRCHRRKSRCDKQVPVCGPCVKAGVACVYTDRSKEPTYRKEVVERLERRLKHSEANNRALAARLARANSVAAAAASQQPLNNGENSKSNPSVASQSSPGDNGQSQQLNANDDGNNNNNNSNNSNNEVSDEVTFLSLTAGGDRQFLGSGSGVLFANLVRATVDSTPVPISTPTAGVNTNAFHSSQGFHTENNATGSRDSISSPKRRKTESYQIPPESFARDLHHAYFEHDHLCFPFLHRPTALAAFEQVYADPSFLDGDTFSCFVFYMILAISSVDFHKFDWQTRPDAENFHVVALSRLNEVLQMGGIETLQAILLLCQYRMRSPMQDTTASMWHLVGVASRISIEQGLHREATYQAQQSQRQTTSGVVDNVIRSEVQRRCFFSVIAMDRIVSTTLGRPLAIRLEDIGASLPDPELDLQINPAGSNFHSSTTNTFSRTALFVHVVRYRILCAKILDSLHGGQAEKSKYHEVSAFTVRENLAAELERWRHDTVSLNLPAVDLSSTIPGDRSSFRAHEWYELLYYNALLMLYRPSPALSASSSAIPVAIQTIFNAAKQSITLYAHLHRSRRINYTWITLHAVFMAGLSYIYAVGRHFRAKRRLANGEQATTMLDEDPSIIEVVNETRACSTVIVAVSERWSASRHSHEVFHRLSDAVLADAIELLNNPNPRSNQSLSSPPPGQITSPANIDMVPMVPITSNGIEQWSIPEPVNSAPPPPANSAPLAVDSVLRDCFGELQHMHEHSCGDDPIGRLSQDWLGEIGGMALDAVQVWDE